MLSGDFIRSNYYRTKYYKIRIHRLIFQTKVVRVYLTYIRDKNKDNFVHKQNHQFIKVQQTVAEKYIDFVTMGV